MEWQNRIHVAEPNIVLLDVYEETTPTWLGQGFDDVEDDINREKVEERLLIVSGSMYRSHSLNGRGWQLGSVRGNWRLIGSAVSGQDLSHELRIGL